MNKSPSEPYAALGAKLKHYRTQWQQTVTEVSNTLEIDEKTLMAIEAGKTIPSENELEMFISHFLLTDEQADDIRDLADNFKEQATEGLASGIEDMLMKQIVMYAPPEGKILYTDSMQATVNKSGVVLQFMQGGNGQAPQNQQQIMVSRVGMSREHAERMIEVLRTTLDQHYRSESSKTLPSPKKDKK